MAACGSMPSGPAQWLYMVSDQKQRDHDREMDGREGKDERERKSPLVGGSLATQ